MRVGIPPGENQKEILEQILGPFRRDLVRLYAFDPLLMQLSTDLYLQLYRQVQCSVPNL